MNKQSRWYQTMLARFGSEEAIRAVMAERGKSGGVLNKGKKVGFASWPPEKLRLNNSKAGRISRRNKQQQ